ncbi:hypothetical protein WN944_000830 [Citrus x changshan-huyou]|uniref:Uncharacterized protein n=1 Tax=Citrus x changshan-huyou TaxID=2935761 RepID=A0AAP0MG35_9ROSI
MPPMSMIGCRNSCLIGDMQHCFFVVPWVQLTCSGVRVT